MMIRITRSVLMTQYYSFRIMMSMILTESIQRFFPNLEEIPEESRCSTIMKERKEDDGENDILSILKKV